MRAPRRRRTLSARQRMQADTWHPLRVAGILLLAFVGLASGVVLLLAVRPGTADLRQFQVLNGDAAVEIGSDAWVKREARLRAEADPLFGALSRQDDSAEALRNMVGNYERRVRAELSYAKRVGAAVQAVGKRGGYSAEEQRAAIRDLLDPETAGRVVTTEDASGEQLGAEFMEWQAGKALESARRRSRALGN